MSNGIYCYIDKKNNTIVYVGKDSYIDKQTRHKAHCGEKKYNEQQINKVLQNNPNRYKYKVLKEGSFSEKELNEFEKFYIQKYNPLFNFTEGGDGILGYKHTDEAIEKIRQNAKGNQNFLGKKHTKEAKEKIRQSKIGNKNPMKKKENKAKVSNSLKEYYKENDHPFLGKKHSKATKDKISIVQSQKNNTSGYYRVYKHKSKSCKQGFTWEYRYTDEDGKRKKICSVDLDLLEKKVKAQGFEWRCFNE